MTLPLSVVRRIGGGENLCGECGFGPAFGHSRICTRWRYTPHTSDIYGAGSLSETRSPRRVPPRTQPNKNRAVLASPVDGSPGTKRTRRRYATPEHALRAALVVQAEAQAAFSDLLMRRYVPPSPPPCDHILGRADDGGVECVRCDQRFPRSFRLVERSLR